MLYSGAFLKLLAGAISGSCDPTIVQNDPDTAIIRLIFALTYVISLGLLILRWKRVLYLVSNKKSISILSISILLGLAFISCLWSENFSTTLIPSIALIGTTLFGFYLGSRYPLQRQLQLLGWAYGIMILSSIVFAVALPSIGTMCAPHEGAWRGIFGHKNGLGKAMTVSTVIYWLLIEPTKLRLLPWLGLSCSLLLLILSTSTSSLIIVVALLMLLPIYQSLRLREDVLAPVILSIAILLICSFVLLFSNAEFIVGYFGKDLTLTGRTDLWEQSLKMIRERIFLGYGYENFWQGWDSPTSAYVWRAIGWSAPNAHNGLLDLALDLGLLGTLVFLAGFLSNLARAFVWVRLTKNSASFWPLMYLSFLFLTNITETMLLSQNSLIWVLYVAVTLSISTLPARELNHGLKDRPISSSVRTRVM